VSIPPGTPAPSNGLTRRELLALGLALSAGWAPGAAPAPPDDLPRDLLDRAARLEAERRARFADVTTRADLDALQAKLRATFLRLLGGLPESPGAPPSTRTGRIDADDYVIEKLVFESLPGYHVPALLYRPKHIDAPRPGILSPCGHSEVGKAAEPYQILHINLVKRGFIVLTFDPVGQGERSQFWDAARGASRYNRVCGEHAVLGNPLYLLGTNLARYRIIDGRRALDYLAARPEVDAARLGCVGNSGGGNLTAYLTALEPRIAAAAICCYITTLPRRMGNRIEADPDSDPEQDLFGFVGEGIDHAGLLALCAPRPTLLGTARLDFFPIEGARESFGEAQRLDTVAGAAGKIERVEAPGRHGLSQTLREAVYRWFGRWLAGRDDPADAAEITVQPRPAADLNVCPDGQVLVSFDSKHLLPLALAEFRARPKPAPRPLRDILGFDPDEAHPVIHEIQAPPANGTLVVCVNGNESPGWQEQPDLLQALSRAGFGVAVVDPRGVGAQRPDLEIEGRAYTDPLSGVEANLAYNAFLIGQSLVGLRASDIAAAARRLIADARPRRLIVCARRDAALAALSAAALEPAIDGLAVESMLVRYESLFTADCEPINAASIVPNLLRDFGDIPDVLASLAPRRVLLAAGIGAKGRDLPHVRISAGPFTSDPRVLIDWMRG
jgi:dienelactone hydrolase